MRCENHYFMTITVNLYKNIIFRNILCMLKVIFNTCNLPKVRLILAKANMYEVHFQGHSYNLFLRTLPSRVQEYYFFAPNRVVPLLLHCDKKK